MQVQPALLGITSANSVNVVENTTSVLTVTASDGGLPVQLLSFVTTSGADKTKFSIHPSNGTLSFQAAPDFDHPLDADSNNIYVVTVEASDGASSVAQTIEVTVTGVNDNAPVFAFANSISLLENSTNVLTVMATDGDLPHQSISFTIVGGMDQNKFSLAPTTGVLTFRAAPDFETPTDSDHNNTYIVQVQADDGNGGVTLQTITVTITDVIENPDLILRSFVADGSTTSAGHPRLTVVYEVAHLPLPGSFQIQFLKSADALANVGLGGDTALGTAITLSDPADRTVGLHTVFFTIGTTTDAGTRGAVSLLPGKHGDGAIRIEQPDGRGHPGRSCYRHAQHRERRHHPSCHAAFCRLS